MSRLLAALLLAVVVPGIVSTQGQPEVIRTWQLRWIDVSDPLGNQRTQPYLVWPESEPREERARYVAAPGISIVATLEEEFRKARLANDTEALTRILSDDFIETNQNGDRRTRAELLDLSRTALLQSLTITSATVRSRGTAVITTGEQTETTASGTDRLLFTRVYVQESSNTWRLLTSTQFRRP